MSSLSLPPPHSLPPFLFFVLLLFLAVARILSLYSQDGVLEKGFVLERSLWIYCGEWSRGWDLGDSEDSRKGREKE